MIDLSDTSPLPRLGFLGAGKMASALVRGLLRAGLTTADRLLASDLPSVRHPLTEACGVEVLDSNLELVDRSDVVVLAVKPQSLPGVLAEIRPRLEPRHLVVSVAAGWTLSQLAAGLGHQVRLVRVMPNTPALVGAGAAAFCPGSTATEEDARLVERLLRAVGLAYRLPENLFDAITALPASGPAFVAVVIEALADGGVKLGLSREVALALAAQTAIGTGKMLLDGQLHPGQLRDMVASPGGTTIAGLHALERGGVRAAVMDAVEAAGQRAAELGRA